MTWARHIRHLTFASFRHAQGSQALQVHFVQSYLRTAHASGAPVSIPPLHRILTHADTLTVPIGHLHVDAAHARAQFLFWAHNIWDIAHAILAADPGLLPDRGGLDDRAATVDARPDMSSFSKDELDDLGDAFEIYRAAAQETLTAEHVVHQLFVPRLLDVELGFQGAGDRYPTRPRTDGGDLHESRMLGHCLAAHQRHTGATPSITGQVYRLVCRGLDRLYHADAEGPIATRYRQLIAAYNLHHPTTAVSLLHVPEHDFAAGDPVPRDTAHPFDDKDNR